MADSRTLRVVIVGNADSAEDAIQGLADTSEDAGGQFDAMGGKMAGFKGALAGMGAAVLAALPLAGLLAFAKGLEEIENRAKLAAQLGLTGKDAAQAGKLAGDLYVKGFGESTAETGEIVKRVSQDLNMSVNDVDFKPIAAKVGTIAEVMDQEIGGTTRAVANLLRNGLAKNADEALDIVAAGFTNGVDKSEDFLDTLNEYGTQFRKLGLDGATATGILSQGLKGGARDADIVADAIKEFSIRAVDGSKTTADGFKAIGLDASDMAKRIGQGGKTASDALQETMDKLRGMKDPVKQSQAAVQLFGTQSEDLGKALYSIDPKSAVDSLGKVGGAADQMADTMHNNAAAKLTTFKRKLEMGFTNAAASAITAFEGVGKKLGPTFDKIGQATAPFLRGLGEIGSRIKTSFETGAARTALDQLGQKLSGIWAVVGPAVSQFVTFFKTQLMPVFQELWAKAQPVLVQLWQTFMTYLDFIKLEIQGFIAVVKWLWQTFGATLINYVKVAWNAVWQVISGVLSVIQGIYNVFIGVFTGDWSRAWQGIKQIFSGVWNIIVGIFRAVWNTIKTVLKLGVDAVKGIWSLAWKAVSSLFKSIWSGITGHFSGVMGTIRGYASSGVTAVKNFFVNGFTSLYTSAKGKLSNLVSAVKEIPGKAKAALSGLPGQMLSIGRNIIDGIVNGIRGSLSRVMSAAQAIVDKIPGPIKKALGIHSPSRVMKEIGKWVTEGLVKGMLGGSKKVAATSKKLHELITKAYKGKAISKKKADSLHKYISSQNRKLTKLAKEREKIQKAIGNANAKLTDLKKAKADMASSVSSKAKDYGSFMGALDTSQYGDNSASAIIGRLKAKLKGIVDFRKNLATLAKRGLGKGIISELAQAGPEEGGQMAAALLNAGGGQIKELNSTYSAIGSQSNALGSQVAGNYYNAGIKATEGLIRGLKAKEKHLTKAIENMSKAMVKALKKALGIKSPSRVFMGLGGFTAAGFTNGIRNGQGDVQKAVDEMAGTRPSGRLANRSIARAMALQGASGGQAAPVVHVTVQGNVTAEKALAKSIATTIRDEIVRNGKRNGGRTGL
ncbi:phage tail tape measure protein [Streptomyces sp. ALI-76-A]|uniref:phage tail tape measure protein n=1 Tax=Streptomyces sp. ALI-76-A TaxID=3025736 RepID=UPI00256F2A51|nr:phage tail tape measure protein [Streptomyces sp. ALI-76-A]MDL5204958.1 phage tail tape measure protein [Streptomyces sp. ALI-76-A]